MTTQRVIKNQEFTGVRVQVETPLPFDEVLQRLRDLTGHTSIHEIVAVAQQAASERDYAGEVEKRFVGSSGFMLFAEIDHGGWIAKFGIKRKTLRWIWGNPLIAITMIRHDLAAGLFAPVELLLTEQIGGTERSFSTFAHRPLSSSKITPNCSLQPRNWMQNWRH